MLLINILLAMVWVALTGNLTPLNLFIGFLTGYALLRLSGPGKAAAAYFSRVPRSAGLALFFLRELIKANLRVAHDVLTPRLYMRPGIVAIPLDASSDAEITLLANLITLTPGSFSVDVAPDRKTLYVHSMFIEDPERVRHEIKQGLERRVLEVMR